MNKDQGIDDEQLKRLIGKQTSLEKRAMSVEVQLNDLKAKKKRIELELQSEGVDIDKFDQLGDRIVELQEEAEIRLQEMEDQIRIIMERLEA